jgi:hypothetical protein
MSHRSIPLVLAAVTLAACTARSDDQAARSDSVGDTTTQASAGAASGAAPRVVTVVATDYAFEAPAEIPAGLTTFELRNQGRTLHHAQLVKLDSGKTAQDYVKALKPNAPPPAWSVAFGGPNAPNPGATANATVNLEPGNYALICFVDTPDHVPHFIKGMVRDLKVTPAAAGAPAPVAPTADVTLTMNDYDFGLPQSIAPGRHTIRVTNAGPQVHEIELVRLAPGKTMQDFLKWGATFQGPPPGDAIGGIAFLENGRDAYFTVDLTPGNYLAICFVPDAKDGRPHFVHGMIKEFRVGGATSAD